MASKSLAFSSELLASVAVVACEVVLGFAQKCQSPAGADIAVRLHLISNALQSQPVYQLSPEIQTLSHKALQDLLEICTWPTCLVRDWMRLNSQELYDILFQKFHSDKDQMNKSIKKFLMQKQDHIEPYQQRFANLSDKLNRADQSGADQNNPYDHYLKPREEDIYPERINRSLIDSSRLLAFMPVDSQPNSRVPLKAFVSFPLGHYSPSPKEYLEMGDFTHRYPRILFLGIILLEIGLGEPFGLEPFDPNTSKLSLLSHTNKAHAKAKMRLSELKKAKWDDFSYKDIFVEAVENCLDSRNFKETRRSVRKHRRRDQADCQDSNDAMARVLTERRVSLYKKVVAPLFWLANVGFNLSADIQFITMRSVEPHKSAVAEDDGFRKFWQEIKKPTFDSGSASQTDGWMDRLKVICGHVLRCQKRTKIATPIRVAILDTGCDTNLAFFQKAQISSCLKGWKDFAAGSQSHVDNFGHGSFMARLLLQVAPIVDLHVARVAETQDQLEENEINVARAIECAGLDWKVDVISMSFGFPKTSMVISDAIDKVKKERANSVIFLASAGNSSTDRGEAFPARHPSVISIYATDYQGTYLKTNPTKSEGVPRPIGTYGDNIPTTIIEELQKSFPEGDFSPGTSIATAITAGIVTIMLSYIAALPGLLQVKGFEEIFGKLKTGEGMAHMLRAMAVDRDHQGDFINPVGFWSDRSEDKKMFVAICKAISDLSS
ncbi:hypothetical protein B7463_g5278, partial [Scytalidium lignicola]